MTITAIHYARFVVFNKKFNPFGYDGNLSAEWKNLVDYQWRSGVGRPISAAGTYYGRTTLFIPAIMSSLFMYSLLSSISDLPFYLLGYISLERRSGDTFERIAKNLL